MAAQTGEPVATYLTTGIQVISTRPTVAGLTPLAQSPIEIQKPMPDALLAVCGACGFEWDADHVVYRTAEEDVPVYECPKCVAKHAVEQMTIAANQRDEATEKMRGLASVDHLQREVEHLRPQNALLVEEAGKMREALRLLAIGYQDQTNGAELMGCRCCRGTWRPDATEEAHVRGCLADKP